MPADLSRDANGPGAVTYGLWCDEHPDAVRRGLTQAHATNAVAKHNRDHHAEPEGQVNISAACALALESLDQASRSVKPQALAEGALAVQFIYALTGLTEQAAIDQAQEWAEARPAITAHVSPF